MMKVARKFIIAKPWQEIVEELVKEGCQVRVIKQDGAVLYADKTIAVRTSHSGEN